MVGVVCSSRDLLLSPVLKTRFINAVLVKAR